MSRAVSGGKSQRSPNKDDKGVVTVGVFPEPQPHAEPRQSLVRRLRRHEVVRWTGFAGGFVATLMLGVSIGYYQLPPFEFLREAKLATVGEVTLRNFSQAQEIKPPAEPEETGPPPVDPHSVLANSGHILFVGDSITSSGQWHELMPGLSIANRAVGGHTVEDTLARTQYLRQPQSKLAFIMLGVNDLRSREPVAMVAARYANLVAMMIEWDMQVVIQSTLSCGEAFKFCPVLNPRIEELNQVLQGIARVNPQIEYLDVNTLLAPEGLLLPQFTDDGIHINATAYRTWADGLTGYLKERQLLAVVAD